MVLSLRRCGFLVKQIPQLKLYNGVKLDFFLEAFQVGFSHRLCTTAATGAQDDEPKVVRIKKLESQSKLEGQLGFSTWVNAQDIGMT